MMTAVKKTKARGVSSKLLIALIGSLFLYTSLVSARAELLIGYWQTPRDPRTGETSVVQLSIEGKTLQGRLIKILDDQGKEVSRACSKCPGTLKNKSLAGMVFIDGLVLDKDRWVGGRVLDLRPGLTQGMQGTVEITWADGKAVVHGYKGLRVLGETSVWVPYRTGR